MAVKFYDDGRPRPYPGNTIICDIDRNSLFYRALLLVRDELRAFSPPSTFAFVPSESFHVTLFRGVNDQLRVLGEWPRGLALDMPLEAVTREFRDRLQSLTLPSRFCMRPLSLVRNSTNDIQLIVEGVDEAEKEKIQAVRDLLSETLRHERSGDATYKFHITFCYRLRALCEEDAAQIDHLLHRLFAEHFASFEQFEMGPPQLSRFDDMMSYHPVLDLSSPGDSYDI